MTDESWLILNRILSLVFISILRGSILIWLIFPSPHIISLTVGIKVLTLFVCLLGGLVGYIISICSLFFYNKSLKLKRITSFLIIIWFMPFISTLYITEFPLKLGGLIKTIDQGWREYFGANNLFKYIIHTTKIYQTIHLNNVKLYLLRFIFW